MGNNLYDFPSEGMVGRDPRVPSVDEVLHDYGQYGIQLNIDIIETRKRR